MPSCNNCGSDKTIRSHLIPRAFCVEVLKGASHAAQVTQNSPFTISQSGVIDKSILCGDCDGILGEYENYVFTLCQNFRHHTPMEIHKFFEIPDANIETIMRFCAGIIYKYSLTTPRQGKIQLGRYQEVLRNFIFNKSDPIPSELGLFIFRPMRFPDDHEVWAYRAPKDDRKNDLNYFRMMMGGLIFFVFLDKRLGYRSPDVKNFVKKGSKTLSIATVSAFDFEEYTIPQKLAFTPGKLSDYLDKLALKG